MPTSLLTGTLRAVTVLTNCWTQSLRFYTEALGYQRLEEGLLTDRQRTAFGTYLRRFALFGHEADPGGSVVRLLETTNTHAQPNRVGARPWDTGMAVFEAGTPDVDRAYQRVLQARFGAISPPIAFDAEGPEPLGYVVMKSTSFIGPAGEQLFVTQIVRRRGGQSLLQESTVEGINTPLNCVFSNQNRNVLNGFWHDVMGVVPVNDLTMTAPELAPIMGGSAGMGFDMLLMGSGTDRIGMEQHVFGPHNPDFTYQNFPCTFEKTGLAIATWRTSNLAEAHRRLTEHGSRIVATIGLPLRDLAEPNALVFEGPLGELIELIG